jgi:hypothetical protein
LPDLVWFFPCSSNPFSYKRICTCTHRYMS